MRKPLVWTSLLLGTLATILAIILVWKDFHRPTQIKTRPIAEYEPTYAIAMSEDLLARDVGIQLLKAIIKAGAKVYLFRKSELLLDQSQDQPVDPRITAEEWKSVTPIQIDHESFWLRDYLPLPLLRLYPHLPPVPTFLDFVYRDAKSFDDVAIYQFALAIDSSIEHVPLVLDGGNFMTDGFTCLISQEIKRDLSAPSAPSHAEPADLMTIVHDVLGCQQTLAVSAKPHPHVDMWIKFMSKNQVLVNQIDGKALELASSLSSEEQSRIKEIKNSLDLVAKDLSKAMTVTRIPMPLPTEATFMTYANSVIVNKTIITPSFLNTPTENAKHPDAELFPAYEQRVREVFEHFGFQTQFIEADQLIREGGAFHCVTYHLNNLEDIARQERNSTPK